METKKIVTPKSKIEVEIRQWITLAEWEEIQKPITDMKLTLETARGLGKGEINVGEAQQKSIDASIKIVVVSIDGKTDDILNRVKQMRKEDGLFLIKAIDDVVSGKDFTQPVGQK